MTTPSSAAALLSAHPLYVRWKRMKEFKHPPTKGIKYCSILLWIESVLLLALPPLAFFSASNSNTLNEKIIYSVVFIFVGILTSLADESIFTIFSWQGAFRIILSFCGVSETLENFSDSLGPSNAETSGVSLPRMWNFSFEGYLINRGKLPFLPELYRYSPPV